MTVKPILFSPEMVRAILEGRKTQTRRVLKPQPQGVNMVGITWPDGLLDCNGERLPYRPRDLLYVREAWRTFPSADEIAPRDLSTRNETIHYEADGLTWDRLAMNAPGRLRAAMHMPRWASRITLKVTNVRVERVQDISEEDAKAEGCAGFYTPMHPDQGVTDGQMPHEEFRDLWNSLNTKRGYGWDINPWVSAITFEPIFQNINAYMGKEAA